jgi:glycosyltransferase involved in cell wall biosynthesis
VNAYIANSEATRRRIGAYWGREASVVHPPVETQRFQPGPVGDHFLVLSELMSHKRIDNAVRACSRLGLPLVVAGDGPDARRLHRIAGPTVRFAGRVSDAEAARLLQSCRALIVTAVEEFGIAAVEAQAAGRPVIAADAGGVRESVVEGVTGRFFDGGVDDLVAVLRGFDEGAFDPRDCVDNAARFGLAAFRREFPRRVAEAVDGAARGAAQDHGRSHAARQLRGGLARRGSR